MADKSAIEWTEATWNPTTGCDRISPGCDHCYALTLAGRLKEMGQPRYQRDGDPRTSGPGFGLTLHHDKLKEPMRWRKPRVVFVNSMSDLFHKDVPPTFIEYVWQTMEACPQHTFQILTKRPKRMRAIVTELATRYGVLSNVWLGTSIESRDYVWRADHVRETPAAVRFISAEPLLGPLIPDVKEHVARGVGHAVAFRSWSDGLNAYENPGLNFEGIDWVIVGGESGAGYRPINSEWVRDLRDQCWLTSTAFFFKQWGGIRPKSGGRELDGQVYDEMPVTVHV